MLIYDTVKNLVILYSEPAAYAVVVTVVSVVVFAFIQNRVVVRLDKLSKKTKNNVDDAIVAMVKSIKPSFYWFLSVYLGFQTLPMSLSFSVMLNGVLLAVVLWYVLRAASIAIDMWLAGTTKDAGEKSARHFLGIITKSSLWIVAILLLLSNLGINVTSLVAGLGIGGVAIAFALQNILTDLFSSFAIYFDKPFVVGDYIVIGDQTGIVEKIGIKTTRLRALQGEEIVISNKELTSTRIQNFHSMQSRRIQMTFGILYETPIETVSALPKKIKDMVAGISGIKIDRVHFYGFGNSSLDFALVYYVESGEYSEYMDKQQEINLSILKLFRKENVEFAYPTQTVYMSSTATDSKKGLE